MDGFLWYNVYITKFKLPFVDGGRILYTLTEQQFGKRFTERMAMKYICLYLDYLDKFDQLDDEEAGRLTKALLRYAANGEITDLGRVEMAYFSFIRSNIDREREQYEEKCRKNRANISKRYQKSTTVYDRREEEDKEEYEDEYEEEYEHEKKDEEEEEEKKKDEEIPEFRPPSMFEARDYCKERGWEVDCDMLYDFFTYYDDTDWTVRSGEKMKNWKRALVRWVERQERFDSR